MARTGVDECANVVGQALATNSAPRKMRRGAARCVNVVGQALATDICCFKVMQAQLQLLGRSREFVLPPLAPRYVQDLCRRTQVDGLVVPEAFDSDMLLTRANGTRTVKDGRGKKYQVPTVHIEPYTLKW